MQTVGLLAWPRRRFSFLFSITQFNRYPYSVSESLNESPCIAYSLATPSLWNFTARISDEFFNVAGNCLLCRQANGNT